MTDPVSHPPRLLRWLAWLARWSLGLLLAAALVLAVAWGALHGAIVPRIGEYRVQLQAQAERALGVPVRIGTLSAHTQGLIPSIELGEVALLDAQGRAIAALTVPYAERIDQIQRKSIPEVTEALGLAARHLSSRIGGLTEKHIRP